MIPIFQTKFHPIGNCLDACLASIFEVPINTLPNYHGIDWRDIYNAWLNDRGFIMESEPFDEDELSPNGYHVATIKSPRGDWYHAVVVLNGKVIHDPYPGETITEKSIIVDLDGSRKYSIQPYAVCTDYPKKL